MEIASFTAKSDVSVYVGFDSRVAIIPAWLSNWTNSGESLSGDNSVTFNLYKKDFSSDSIVWLGENGQSTGAVNYTVIIKPNVPLSLKYGDVNNDWNVDTLDFALIKKHILGTELMTGDRLKAADIDGGGSVDALDYSKLKQYLLGLISEL